MNDQPGNNANMPAWLSVARQNNTTPAQQQDPVSHQPQQPQSQSQPQPQQQPKPNPQPETPQQQQQSQSEQSQPTWRQQQPQPQPEPEAEPEPLPKPVPEPDDPPITQPQQQSRQQRQQQSESRGSRHSAPYGNDTPYMYEPAPLPPGPFPPSELPPAPSSRTAGPQQAAQPQQPPQPPTGPPTQQQPAVTPTSPPPEPPPSSIVGKHSSPGQYDLTPPTALNQSVIVNPVKRAPKGGWRKFVHGMTGGYINPGDSARNARADELLQRIQTPLRGDYRIAVMSLKGGVGKTTTTVTLGGVFASLRGDRVIAIDANPDLGTLAQRVAAPGPSTIRDLLAATDTSRYPQVRSYTTQAKSRLEVIGSERDPAFSESFSEMDYRRAIDILQHHYNVILTDCGTGLMHSAMAGVLDLANTLILVSSPALDGAQSASATLDWLNLHGYEQLAANSVVVISGAHPGQATIDMDQLISHFRSRTRAVQVIPFDRHLSEGAVVDLDLISKNTMRAYKELAAIVAEDFDRWHRHSSGEQ